MDAVEASLHETVENSYRRELQESVDSSRKDSSLSPWFVEYRKEFFSALQFAVHESQDDPVLCTSFL